MGKKVVVAMSGGVDSSVAAALLLEQGYEVIGITLNVWPSEGGGLAGAKTCCSVTDVDDARQVCYKLGIPHYVLNMRDLFKEKVIDYFVDEYLKGRTPNPCIACNAHVKFEALLLKSTALGADFMATGHYAAIERDGTGEYRLRRSGDPKKDQTYVLYMLSQRQLARLLLPCGGYKKEEVRAIARRGGLPTFQKADSQDLCFIGPEGYAGFIRKNCGGAKPRSVEETQRRELGRKDQNFYFTIGKSKGKGSYTNQRMFVTKIDPSTGTVTLGSEEDLMKSAMIVEDLHFISGRGLSDGRRVAAKIRYNAPEAGATVHNLGPGMLRVVFDAPQRAVTPGQAAVFYEGDIVLGGGRIVRPD